MTEEKKVNEEAIDNNGQPYTEEQLNNMTEDELNEVLASPVRKGEVIQLVRNLVGIELDSFRKFIGEPLRVMSIQNLAIIELLIDKEIINSEADLQPYFDKVREKMQAEERDESDEKDNNDSTNKEEKEQQE